MYLIAIAWIYVVLMMAAAEATSSQGTVLGGVFTFLLYGVMPLSIVLYIFATPARKRSIKDREAREARKAREAASLAATNPPEALAAHAAASATPDGSRHAPGDAAAAVRKEP